MHIGSIFSILIITGLVFVSITPAFADTIQCTKTTSGNSTVITCPNISTTQTAPAPYYTNPTPTIPQANDAVNFIFNKLGQAAVQLSGSNAQMIQNATNTIQTVVSTGIDFVYALKYLASVLLGLIIPKLFGINTPPFLLPAIEWIMVALIVIAVWKHAWKIFLLAIAIGLLIILLVFAGGVLFH